MANKIDMTGSGDAAAARASEMNQPSMQADNRRFGSCDSSDCHVRADDLQLMDDFCEYLEHRVHTKNIPLLRRIMLDYLHDHDYTLTHFVELGANIIAILPFDIKNSAKRDRAAQLLTARTCETSLRLSSLFSFLHTRVATRNIVMLKRVFVDFMGHQEHTLQEFVAIGSSCISIIPQDLSPSTPYGFRQYSSSVPYVFDHHVYHPHVLVPLSMHHPPYQHERFHHESQCSQGACLSSFSVEARNYSIPISSDMVSVAPIDKHTKTVSAHMNPPSRSQQQPDGTAFPSMNQQVERTPESTDEAPKKRCEQNSKQLEDKQAVQSVSLDKEVEHQKTKTTSRTKPKKSSHFVGNSNSSTSAPFVKKSRRDQFPRWKQEVKDKLMQYEAREPWKVIFNDLPIPFDENKAPYIAKKLRVFWKMHGHAVWERNFWAPLVRWIHLEEFNARRQRQRQAMVHFMAIIRAVYNRFGAELFVKLDKQRHPGWWYRGTILDISAYWKLVGPEKCWKFVNEQAYRRFPDCGHELPLETPNARVLRMKKLRNTSISMWLEDGIERSEILEEMLYVQQLQECGITKQIVGGKRSVESVESVESTAFKSMPSAMTEENPNIQTQQRKKQRPEVSDGITDKMAEKQDELCQQKDVDIFQGDENKAPPLSADELFSQMS